VSRGMDVQSGDCRCERHFAGPRHIRTRESASFHVHPGREEIIYVLEGEAEQWVGKEKRLLKPGEMAHIPKNTPHATYNIGRSLLKFLAILSPVEAEGEFAVDVSDHEPWRSLSSE